LRNSKKHILTKDAGFVHESFRNEMNQIFWDFWPYESNPRYESFKNRSTKQIHDTNLTKTGLRNESAIRILKVWIRESGFASPQAWIRQSRYETNLFGVRIRDHDTKQIHVFTNLLYDSRILNFNPSSRLMSLHFKSSQIRLGNNRPL
jgi:hypothetical protein